MLCSLNSGYGLGGTKTVRVESPVSQSEQSMKCGQFEESSSIPCERSLMACDWRLSWKFLHLDVEGTPGEGRWIRRVP